MQNELGTPEYTQSMVVLTGAGISAESGVPTYRGTEGLWRNHCPQDLATPGAFSRDPDLVWDFYKWRRELVTSCEPNLAHLTLVEMEKQFENFFIITQNVDGLHQRAGSKNVLELHGSLWKIKCTQCGDRWQDFQIPLPAGNPICPSCGSLARPDVVWFGEPLERDILEQAHALSASADWMLVVGTSASIQPANILPLIAREVGARIIEINLEPTPLSAEASLTLKGPAGEVLPSWWDRIRHG
ncbi:MAG: NAD-dependent protein deacylase [Anaerolineales bacterium]|nr:NAD-dependent protein deacylase [Anaerolineales bacterium]